jgi:hypothetical protein
MRDIVAKNFKPRMRQQVLDVLPPPRIEIVDAQDLVAGSQQPLAKV